MAESTNPAHDDLGEFSVEPSRRPVAGVTIGEVPPKLAEYLREHHQKALTDADFELKLTAKDKATASRLAGYARAWGAQQEPKLYIHKVPNGKRYPDNVARLAVELDSEVPEDNRPGRKSNNRR